MAKYLLYHLHHAYAGHDGVPREMAFEYFMGRIEFDRNGEFIFLFVDGNYLKKIIQENHR